MFYNKATRSSEISHQQVQKQFLHPPKIFFLQIYVGNSIKREENMKI